MNENTRFATHPQEDGFLGTRCGLALYNLKRRQAWERSYNIGTQCSLLPTRGL